MQLWHMKVSEQKREWLIDTYYSNIWIPESSKKCVPRVDDQKSHDPCSEEGSVHMQELPLIQ